MARTELLGAAQQHRPFGLPHPHSQMADILSPVEEMTAIEGRRDTATMATITMMLTDRRPQLHIHWTGLDVDMGFSWFNSQMIPR